MQPNYQSGGPYQTPYGQQAPQQQKKSSSFWILIIVLGGGGLLSLVCCGGLGAVAYLGVNVLGEAVKEGIRDDPVVREHLGEVEECDFNIVATGAASEDGDVLVFDVKGTKGSGQIRAKAPDGETIESATLRMPSGEEFDLDISFDL